MTSKHPYRVALVAILTGLFTVTAYAGKYNFDYKSTGETDLLPLQVFDDGKQTYFQMRGKSLVPAVFVIAGDKEVLVQPLKAGDMLSVAAVGKQFNLRFGNLSSQIVYTGGAREYAGINPSAVAAPLPVTPTVAPSPVRKLVKSAYGASVPTVGDGGDGTPDFLTRESLVPFAKGKASLSKEAAAKLFLAIGVSGNVESVSITGRDGQNYAEGLARARAIAIRERLSAAGIPLERMAIKEGIAMDETDKLTYSDVVVTWKNPALRTTVANAPIKDLRWTMTRQDKTVSAMLARWAAAEGWSLLWKATDDPSIVGDASIAADNFPDAVSLVVMQSKALGYTLNVQYANKVLTIK